MIIIHLHRMRTAMMEICEVCDRSFSNKNSLRTHRSRFHGQTHGRTPNDNDSDIEQEDLSSEISSADIRDTIQSSYDSDTRVSRKRRHRESDDDESVTVKHFKMKDNSSSTTLQNHAYEMLRHQELIQILVNALLEGTLPMTPVQIKQIKVYRGTIRQYSKASQIEREEILTDLSNRRCLRLLFETISSSINTIF